MSTDNEFTPFCPQLAGKPCEWCATWAKFTALVAAPPSGEKTATAGGWISVGERLPELGTECIVWCREAAPGLGPYAKVDTWDEQREAPVEWSSATIPIGPGWDGSDFEDVLYWQPLPAPPSGEKGEVR